MADNNLTTASSVKEDAVSATRPSAHASDADATSTPAVKSGVKRPGDRIFEFLSTASATLITVMIAAIAAFLIWRAVPSLSVNEGGILGFFTYGDRWETNDTDAMKFGIPTMFGHTVLISIVALIIAMPVALGIAIFLSNYAPAKLVKPLGFLVDMLAAVPSIVYLSLIHI